MTPSTIRTKGFLISFDGIDSSGKETQAKLLLDRIRSTGRGTGFFQTPDYTTPSGIKLKRLFQEIDGSWNNLSWLEKMKLIASNRVEHRDEVIQILDQDGVVIYDRYVPSSIAHITADALASADIPLDRPSIQAEVEGYEYGHNRMPRENLSIFLDLSPQQAAALLQHRKQQLADADEATDEIDLQQRIYREYQLLVSKYPDRCAQVDCTKQQQLLSIAAISDKVWQVVRRRFPSLADKS
jgi:dTMP kinase